MQISLPDATGLSDGDECTVHFVYRGWSKDAPEGTGYTDEERDSFKFIFKGAAIEPEYLLSNSFGFGGINASLVFRSAR